MRLGEIKKIVDLVTNEDHQIILESSQIFGGQAYLITNYQELSEAFDVINEMSWNDVMDDDIIQLFNKYQTETSSVQMEQADFSKFNDYFNQVNTKFPFFYSILEETTEEQDEKIINIKLPNEIGNFVDLNNINDSLDGILKVFNIDGKYKFIGLDKGTSWYEIMFMGMLSYRFFIGCLEIAERSLRVRKEWFLSEEARISFEISKEQIKGFTIEKYKDDYLKLYIDKKVNEIIEQIKDGHGKTSPELHSTLVKGTTRLVKALGEGVEFHLSYNPPEYAKESKGKIEIDYKKIRQIREQEQKEIESKKGTQIEAGLEASPPVPESSKQ